MSCCRVGVFAGSLMVVVCGGRVLALGVGGLALDGLGGLGRGVLSGAAAAVALFR